MNEGDILLAEFPIDFELKLLKWICDDERLTPSRAMAHYNRDHGFQKFCRGVAGKKLFVKIDDSETCFEVDDNNWPIPVELLTFK